MKQEGASVALFLALTAAAYTNLGISIGGYVAGAILSLLGLAVFALKSRNGLIDNRGRAFSSVVWICLAWLLGLVFDPLFSDNLEQVKSLALMFSALIVFVSVFRLIEEIGAEKFSRIARLLVVVALLGCALEVYTPFTTDGVRAALYGESLLYTSDARDIEIFGNIRPKFFTQEPSHVAKFLTFMTCAFGLSSKGTKLQTMVMFVAGLLLTGSPTIFFGVMIYLLGLHYRHFGRNAAHRLVAVAIVCLLLFIYLNLPYFAQFVPIARAQSIANNTDVSTLLRSSGPAEIALRTMIRYPLSGTGIGARELVQDIVIEVYAKNPYVFIQRFILNPGYSGWGSALFELFVYGGVVFSAVLVALYMRLFWGMTGVLFFPTAAATLILLSDAGFVAPRVWFYIALVLASSHVGLKLTVPLKRRRIRFTLSTKASGFS